MFDTGFEDRDSVLSYLHRHLVGPLGGAEERLEETPHQRYLTGILYPIPTEDGTVPEGSPAVAPAEDTEVVEDTPDPDIEDAAADPVTLSGQNRPSSVGLSFVVNILGPIDVEINLGLYSEVGDGVWCREHVSLDGDQSVRLTPEGNGHQKTRAWLLAGVATLEATWRPHRGGWIVTVVLVNRNRHEPRTRVDPAGCLFQVVVRCRPVTGGFTPYPLRPHPHSDDEEEELGLQYRNTPTYALGHGAAAEWDRGSRHPRFVQTSFLPTHVVPDVEFDLPEGNSSVLELARLARIDEDSETLLAELNGFVDDYGAWIDRTRATVSEQVEPRLRPAAERLLARAEIARDRMHNGVLLLADSSLVRRAFGLANRAMLMQMVHGRSYLSDGPRRMDEAFSRFPDHEQYEGSGYTWRPFQLGFLLLTMYGTLEDVPYTMEGVSEREIVDLIWFPTGGGKTEAYLGLAALAIMYRRLRWGDDGAGTTVITRYTLRLLTAQQFQRASTMIAACELLRRDNSEQLGSRPISIGIWVGGTNTPNSFTEARKVLRKLQAGQEVDTGFQIDACPWCGTRIIPDKDEDSSEWGIAVTNNSFRVRCRNRHCPFVDHIPLSSVDEDLYENPPTMLIGTVDKFARAAWEARAGVFFGSGVDPGPSLVIQDEFHLISGPLGTLVGLYEAAFDVVMAHNGYCPKIVAATATIRRAHEQVRGVFGRSSALFPPAGTDADDSYFVRTKKDSPGRAYVGVMPQGHTPLTALVHVTAVQLQAPLELRMGSSALDGYSTLVAYHNSLRELGKTITLAHDDIPDRMKVIAKAQDRVRELDDDAIVELTSNVPAARIPRILERMGLSHDDAQAVTLLPTTNMLSVGVDVSRLAMMTVVGQPKTTAEYIQATSRVGRDHQRPGLVVTVYSPSKPRDRSHYESFVPYHSNLYRSVEPTSVTPFSVPARSRALHADLVVLVRHALMLSENDKAAVFDPSVPKFHKLREQFLERARAADPTEFQRLQSELTDLVSEWQDRTGAHEDLRYYSSDRVAARLLRRFPEQGAGWPTLDSMRSVDVEVDVRVRGEDR